MDIYYRWGLHRQKNLSKSVDLGLTLPADSSKTSYRASQSGGEIQNAAKQEEKGSFYQVACPEIYVALMKRGTVLALRSIDGGL